MNNNLQVSSAKFKMENMEKFNTVDFLVRIFRGEGDADLDPRWGYAGGISVSYLANRNIDADALRCVVDMAIFHDIDFKAPLVGPPFPRPSFDDSRPTQHPMYSPNPLANPEPQSTPLPTLQNIPHGEIMQYPGPNSTNSAFAPDFSENWDSSVDTSKKDGVGKPRRSSSDASSSSKSASDTQSKPRSAGVTKRSRMGCLTCRQRKKRCCETRPKCSECSRLRLNCVWPKPGTEHKNKSKEVKSQENTIDHDVYGKIKVLRGIVELWSKDWSKDFGLRLLFRDVFAFTKSKKEFDIFTFLGLGILEPGALQHSGVRTASGTQLEVKKLEAVAKKKLEAVAKKQLQRSSCKETVAKKQLQS
ncbi:Zinc cluster transcription factor czf1 [Candidozyma auris]